MTSDTPDIAQHDPAHETLQRQVDGLHRLLDVTQTLAAEVDLPTILKAIIDKACVALDCERASLFQYDPHSDELFTTAVTALEIGEIRKPCDLGICGYVARRRTIANVPDPGQDARWNASVDQITGFETRNILAAPLASPRDDGLLGVLQVLNKRRGDFDETDQRLIAAFAQHAAVALDRAHLVDQLKRREQAQVSLRIARDIQRRFMPHRMPKISGYELATWWRPQEAVGGDYCDVFFLRDGRLGFCIADVSGHGIGPSLIMASVRAALRALLLKHSSPEVLLKLLAGSLAVELFPSQFITMLIAALDPGSHRLEYANGGHAPAMHYSASNGTFTPLAATGLPLGVLEQPEYPMGSPVIMETGDLIVLCTDGIIDATEPGGERFGEARLQRLIRQHAAGPVQELVQRVGAEIERFSANENPVDDLMILALRRTHQPTG